MRVDELLANDEGDVGVDYRGGELREESLRMVGVGGEVKPFGLVEAVFAGFIVLAD